MTDITTKLAEALNALVQAVGYSGMSPQLWDKANNALIDFEEARLSDGAKFDIGDRVRKLGKASWQGRVVGTYSTAITPEGYAVESEREVGSVQIYPSSALELVP